MRQIVLIAALAAVAVPSLPAHADDRDRHRAHKEYRKDMKDARKDYRKDVKQARKENRHVRRDYDYNRVDPRYGNYHADRYYRDGSSYQPRRLSYNDRVYRGSNGRYYCRRDDGTTGLIIGGLGGGVLGNLIAPGGSKTLGTIIGAGAGALIGRGVDRDNVTCR